MKGLRPQVKLLDQSGQELLIRSLVRAGRRQAAEQQLADCQALFERVALLLVALWIPLQLLALWPAPLTPAFDGSAHNDAAIFAYEGALVRQGGMPYLTFWDHKGPLIYLINAAGLSLSGSY